jgi:cytochrome oxidase Cu insertion factor (SCO1/SenC/PrrC family)
MSSRTIDLTNYLVVGLFKHALFVDYVLWFGVVAFIALMVLLATQRIFRFNLLASGNEEPRARTYLRWGFGAIWLVDGILQFQSSMPLGLANLVIRPMAQGTPSWLHSLMLHFINLWNEHPIALAAGVAWFQVGIGLVILVSKGRTGRWGAGVSALWAGFIWLIGNGAGGFFTHGASILFGWPGATLFYVAVGVWLFVDPVLFQKYFSTFVLRFTSLVFLVAIIYQSLPSAGFWHGGKTNALAAMSSTMAKTPQPHPLAWVVRHGGVISAHLGVALNIIVILWLLTCSYGLWRSVATKWRWPIWTAVTGCLILWVVAQDAALYGGLSTDFNSLLPLAVLIWCASPRLRELAPRAQRVRFEMTSGAGAVVATFAWAMIVASVVSMGVASVRGPENTFFLAQNGSVTPINSVAAPFTLTNQFDKPYSLGEHAGYVTVLTFLDPVCWTDCPLIANQLADVRAQLSPNAKVDIVAVAADPYHEKISDVRHFIALRDLSKVKDFYFVTGKLSATSKVWSEYGIGVTMTRTDAMSIHSDYVFIISPAGHLKWVIPDDPLASTSMTVSSVAQIKTLLATQGIH